MNIVDMYILLWKSNNTRKDNMRNENILDKINVARIKEKTRENSIQCSHYVLYRPTNASIQQVKLINEGQVKRATE